MELSNSTTFDLPPAIGEELAKRGLTPTEDAMALLRTAAIRCEEKSSDTNFVSASGILFAAVDLAEHNNYNGPRSELFQAVADKLKKNGEFQRVVSTDFYRTWPLPEISTAYNDQINITFSASMLSSLPSGGLLSADQLVSGAATSNSSLLKRRLSRLDVDPLEIQGLPSATPPRSKSDNPALKDMFELDGSRDNLKPVTDEATSQDLLNRRPFADFLVKTIIAAHRTSMEETTSDDQAKKAVNKIRNRKPELVKSGFAVHLHAPWGAGKSSVLLMMANELESKSWEVVTFNAWEHERRDPPWWPLIQQIKEKRLSSERSIARWCTRIAWYRWLLRTHLMPLFVAAVLAILLGMMWWSSSIDQMTDSPVTDLSMLDRPAPQNPSKVAHLRVEDKARPTEQPVAESNGDDATLKDTSTTEHWFDRITKISTGLAALMSLFMLVFGVSRSTLFGSTKSADFAMDLSVNPLSPVQNLFYQLVQADQHRISKEEPNQIVPICVFIDDLDRCNPNYVVDLMEGIQTSFRHPDVVYIVAADRAWLRTAFRERYGAFRETVGSVGRPIGYLFLDKLFQISTPLPRMTDDTREVFWDVLLHNKLSGKKINEPIDPNTQEVIEKAVGDNRSYANIASLAKQEKDPRKQQAYAEMLHKSSEIEFEATHALSKYKEILPLNPRTIKRIVNAINVKQNICMIERNYQPLDIIVRWTVIEQCYPALVDVLRDAPDLVKQFGQDSPEVDDSTPQIIKESLKLTELKTLLTDRNTRALLFSSELIENMSY